MNSNSGNIGDASLRTLGAIFASRIGTLAQLIATAETHFGNESFLALRIAPDMLPFGTQVSFACDQARNFAFFRQGKPAPNLHAQLTSLAQAREYVAQTQALLEAGGGDDGKLTEHKRVALGPEFYCELTGASYIHDFLMPNLYFHLVTAYDILRMAGVPIGKKDFLQHLGPHIRKA